MTTEPAPMTAEAAAAPRGPAGSIQKKLIASSVVVLVTSLAGFLAAVIWINASLASRQKEDAFQSIRNGLIAKGSILVSNNSQALQGMVADNAFLAVAGLVASTVQDDEDVIYGIYMDDARRPWVYADSANPNGNIDVPVALEDSASLWAAKATGAGHRRFNMGGTDVIEFFAPVRSEDKVLGVVRYGLTTARMNAALDAASRSSRQALMRTILALVFLGGVAAFSAFLAARRQAMRITRPIKELQAVANAIAGGDYARPVSIVSDDEIGLLAADFDFMRRTVKEYTERLQDMVAEKIQEIKDILDNIEQGLFTINLDGKINPDYALSTNMILDVEDVSRSDLAGLFRLEPDKAADWMDWLEMVRQRHGALRWEKLVRLCPIRELRLSDGGAGERIILVGYQKMFDRQKKLNKLMVLVQDVTDARRVERMIKEEKDRHDNEVKAILGIVRYSAFIPDFLADVETRLRAIGGGIHRAPSATDAVLGELTAAMSRDLHTLKGTAATYGFESLSRLAREAEETLEELRKPNHPPMSDEWAVMAGFVESMEKVLVEIRALVKSLTGAGAEAAVAIPEQRIRELRSLSKSLDGAGRDPSEPLARLLRACRSIDHVPLDKLADKYRTMLQRVGERLGKRLEFRAVPDGLEVSPSLFAALDEPLVHLLRNAADHGIEMEATRLLHGKPGTGRIQLILKSGEQGWEITVSDDGNGIDVEVLANKALSKGLVEAERLAE
ncbi:MAG: Signal transduction histidine kinase CheA, partial [Fibrobacteres bacterium]|nr:Signal transduction histidine kinase CheA [Fibrobacterota bacterium]